MNNKSSKLQVTIVSHSHWDNLKNPLSAWWRGVANQHRLKKLQQTEGGAPPNHDLRAGRR